MKKTSQENKEKKKKKIILGWLFGILGAVAIATAIAVPLVLLNKKVDHKSEHGFGLVDYQIPAMDGHGVFQVNCDSHDKHTLSNFKLMKEEKIIGEYAGQVTLEAGKDKYVEVEIAIDVDKTTNGVDLVFDVEGFEKPETIKDITIIYKVPEIPSWNEFTNPEATDTGAVVKSTKTLDVTAPAISYRTKNLISKYEPEPDSNVKLSIYLVNTEDPSIVAQRDDFAMLDCKIKDHIYNKDDFISGEGGIPQLDVSFSACEDLLNQTIDFEIRLTKKITSCEFQMIYSKVN